MKVKGTTLHQTRNQRFCSVGGALPIVVLQISPRCAFPKARNIAFRVWTCFAVFFGGIQCTSQINHLVHILIQSNWLNVSTGPGRYPGTAARHSKGNRTSVPNPWAAGFKLSKELHGGHGRVGEPVHQGTGERTTQVVLKELDDAHRLIALRPE